MRGQKRLGLPPDNPGEHTRLLSRGGELGRQVRFLQHGEWARLRSCMRSDVHLVVDIALATGLRWGEVALLRRGDLSFPDEDTAIHQAAGENRTWKLGPPKCRRSRYVVVRARTPSVFGSPSLTIGPTRWVEDRYDGRHNELSVPSMAPCRVCRSKTYLKKCTACCAGALQQPISPSRSTCDRV
jgi:integrase